ncbi:hypothetical protein [Streptomyces sp. NPDC005930]|uniref:hypothetical protein n=1 Tax=Streptomyces sp. NPDC005930 TaxID=3364736 RepID=UPI003684B6F8
MIVRMDGSDDQVEAPRRRFGKRFWGVGGGAAVASAVVAGMVIADDEPDGTADGPSTEGVTRLSGDAFDDTEGLGLLMGGGEVAH